LTKPMRIDLHLHTWGSWDSLSDPEGVLAAARSRGLDRIAITDHNALDVAREMAARHPERVIVGEEVRTAEGVDVIGLYMSRPIPKGTPAEETCRLIRDQGGIVYLPHPYAAGKGGSGVHAERLAPLLDVVEVFNARLLSRDRNRKGEELARRHGLLRGAGSDAHTRGEVGNAWVELPGHANEPRAFLDALAAATTHGRRARPQVFLYSNLSKIRRRLGAGPGRSGRRAAGTPMDVAGGE
jgi:predicted metal-dependent phosphoesterase TrpH